MRDYWKFTFYQNEQEKIRYLYGTEAIIGRRANKTTGERKSLVKLTKFEANYLKNVKKTSFTTVRK